MINKKLPNFPFFIIYLLFSMLKWLSKINGRGLSLLPKRNENVKNSASQQWLKVHLAKRDMRIIWPNNNILKSKSHRREKGGRPVKKLQ